MKILIILLQSLVHLGNMLLLFVICLSVLYYCCLNAWWTPCFPYYVQVVHVKLSCFRTCYTLHTQQVCLRCVGYVCAVMQKCVVECVLTMWIGVRRYWKLAALPEALSLHRAVAIGGCDWHLIASSSREPDSISATSAKPHFKISK